MNKKDTFLSILAGLAVSWISYDYFSGYFWIFLIVLPILSVIGLFFSDLISKKFFFVRQVGRFILAGALADVIDIKAYQFLFLLLPFSLFSKTVSFFTATFIKYWLDKYWTFHKTEKQFMSRQYINKEIFNFFAVAVLGSVFNVVSFYYLCKIEIGIPQNLWVETCIILAALISGVWNFLGYKFIVFKK
jgi:putative flippase GtrA